MKSPIVFLLLLFFVTSLAFSQARTDDEVKVGLVLSGGGAKGLAHIGALKVIDSLGIRVDYVAGTSMGAIVGALYASGYSGKALDSIFRDVDFDKIINDELPRASKTFYERDNSEKYAITLPFDNYKINLPSALSRGQNTLSLLSQLTLHTCDVDQFDQLDIPFFCVATNVETGEPVILDKGSLPLSIAASGAFPSLFQPVIIDDQVLIDGGVVNNYPIDELKAKGMDVIIGVDVQDGLADRDQLKSALSILLQINNYRTINDMKGKIERTDIYIKPDIEDFTVMSFDDGNEIISQGEIAAKKLADTLSHLAKRQTKGPRIQKAIKSIDSLRINSIIVSGTEKYTSSYVIGKLKFKAQSDISYEDLVTGVNNLAATNNFQSVINRLKSSKYQKGYDLYIHVKESQLKTYLRFGLHYDELYKSAALLNLTRKSVLFKNDIATLDVGLGDNIRYNFEYFIDKGFYWSIGLKSRFNQFEKNVSSRLIDPYEAVQPFNSINKFDVELQDFTNQFYFQTLFRRDFALILGAEHKHLKIRSETVVSGGNEEETLFENSNYLSVFGKLKLDTFDNKYFPNQGFYVDGDFHLYLYSSDFNSDFTEYSIAKGTFGYAKNITKNFTGNISVQGGFRIGENENPYLDFVLGGYGNDFINNFEAFFGYDFMSIPGDSYIKGLVTFDYEIFKKNHINVSANFANVGNDIFTNGEWVTAPNFSGYALGYSLETFIGPIEAKMTYSPELKESIWFFNVGFWF